jgi:uncharacterized membrane protein
MESGVLQEMTATLNDTISIQSDPVRYSDVASSGGFMSGQTAMDITSMSITKYDKVSRITSAVVSHITNQASPKAITQKFDRFVLLLHNQLKLNILATKLVERLCEFCCCCCCCCCYFVSHCLSCSDLTLMKLPWLLL